MRRNRKGYKKGGFLGKALNPISIFAPDSGTMGAIIDPARNLNRRLFNADTPAEAAMGGKHLYNDPKEDQKKKYKGGGMIRRNKGGARGR